MTVLGIPLLTVLLILFGPLLIVGALHVFAAIQCPELRRWSAPQQRPTVDWVRTGQVAWA